MSKPIDQRYYAKLAIVCHAAVIAPDNTILLLRRSQGVVRPGVWDLPGGMWEGPIETLQEGLLREVKEEVGFTIFDCQLAQAVPDLDNVVEDRLWLSYTARCRSKHVTLSDEHDAYVWADRDTLANYSLPSMWQTTLRLALDMMKIQATAVK